MKNLYRLIYEDLKKRYAFSEHPQKKRSTLVRTLREAKEDKEKLIKFAGQELADKFFKYKDRLKVEERNLYYWLKRDVEELEVRMSEIENTKSKSRLKKEINEEGAEYLGLGKGYDVYHITTWKASRNLGRNAKWCISMKDSPAYWNDYARKGVKFYFFIGKNPSDKYALALYPKMLEKAEGKLIRDEKSGNWYKIVKTNYELYNSEDDLSYQDASKLPLNLIPKRVYFDFEQLRESGENQEFFIDSGGKLVKVNKESISGNIVIPDNITSIGDEAFSYCDGITGITIPGSVTSIGNRAFFGCSGLTNITIPDNVTSIGQRAFTWCKGLTSAAIGRGVTNISEGAFLFCSALTDVTIPDNVTSIGGSAFQECTGLSNIIIPDSVTNIGDSAFSSCSKLTSITIPDSVTSIGWRAFFNCSELTIYCEAKKQPKKWDENWNPDNRPVIWDYKPKVNEGLSNHYCDNPYLSSRKIK